MPSIPDHLTLFPECVERMSRDEPCCFDLVFIEELEETTHADGASKEPCNASVNWRILGSVSYLTSRDVAGAVFALVGAQPARYSVNVDGDATKSTCIVSNRRVL